MQLAPYYIIIHDNIKKQVTYTFVVLVYIVNYHSVSQQEVAH